MKYIITVEETVKQQHQIFVDCDDFEYLDSVLDKVDYSKDFEDVIHSLSDTDIKMLSVNMNSFEDIDGCEVLDLEEVT